MIAEKSELDFYQKELQDRFRLHLQQRTSGIAAFKEAKAKYLDYLTRLEATSNKKERKAIVSEIKSNEGKYLSVTVPNISYVTASEFRIWELCETIQEHIDDLEIKQEHYAYNKDSKIEEIEKTITIIERLKPLGDVYSNFRNSTIDELETVNKFWREESNKRRQRETIEEITKHDQESTDLLRNPNLIIMQKTGNNSEQMSNNLSIPPAESKDFSHPNSTSTKPSQSSRKYYEIDESGLITFTVESALLATPFVPLKRRAGDLTQSLCAVETDNVCPYTLGRKKAKIDVDVESGFQICRSRLPRVHAREILNGFLEHTSADKPVTYASMRTFLKSYSIVVIENSLWESASVDQRLFISRHIKTLAWDNNNTRNATTLNRKEKSLLKAVQTITDQGLSAIEGVILMHPNELVELKELLNNLWLGSIELLISIPYPKRITSILIDLPKSMEKSKIVSCAHHVIARVAKTCIPMKNDSKIQYFLGKYEPVNQISSEDYTVLYEEDVVEFFHLEKKTNNS